MGKKKSPWNKFVSGILKRKRAPREYKLPTAYILGIADSLHRQNPTKEIIYNTLIDMATLIYEKGLQRTRDDMAFFKNKQLKHMEDDFNLFKDSLDDMIHIKNIKA